MNAQDFQLWEMRSRDSIDVKRCYIDAAGDLLSGVLLSQIIYWHLPNDQGETKLRVKHEDEQWLAKKRDDWWAECRMTPKQFDRAIKILESKRLVVTKLFRFAGSPTKHIRINWSGLLEALEVLADNVFTQRSKSNLPKGENGNLPNGKIDIDETGRTSTEITPEITHTRGVCAEEKSLEVEQIVIKPTEPNQSFSNQQPNLVPDTFTAAPNFLPRENYIHPTQKCDNLFKRDLRPWRKSDRMNDFDDCFIDYLKKTYLPATPHYQKQGTLTDGAAKRWITKREYNEQGMAEIEIT